MHFRERLFYYSVWIAHSLFAVYQVFSISSDYIANGKLWSAFFEPGWKILGHSRKDTANYEWNIWLKELYMKIPLLLVHSILFNALSRKLSEQLLWRALMPLWFVFELYRVSTRAILFTVLCTIKLLLICFLAKRFTTYKLFCKIFVWLSATGCLWLLVYTADYQAESYEIFYLDAVYVAYKLLQLISFSLWNIDNDHLQRDFIDLTESALKYLLYYPYSTILIVTYDSFRIQLMNRRQMSANLDWHKLIILTLRIGFWTVATDLILHFFFMNAFMSDPQLLWELPLLTLSSVGYLAGQFFHAKYMSIFGVPVVVAKVDGMDPPWPPVCISRVSLYSRMWRYFDRGLYAFLREHIFIPVAGPTYTFARRAAGTAASFAFVWLWHGASPAFTAWVLLNMVGIFLENLAKEVWRYGVGIRAQRYLGPDGVRRLTALFHIPCTGFGIFAIFFFLGDSDGETGWVFVQRVIFDGVLRLKMPLVYLLFLGYCFANCCIDMEDRLGYAESVDYVW